MAIYNTSLGRSVDHCHVPTYPCDEHEWTAAEKNEQRMLVAADYPDLVEVSGPTRKYNCHGYAYTRGHGWFDYPDYFIEDNFTEVPMDEAREGDVLIYRQSENGPVRHSARVKEAVGGEILKCRSKWGKVAVVIHDPDYVPAEYGDPWQLLRRRS